MLATLANACTRDAEPAQRTPSAPFQSELPPLVVRDEPGERVEAPRPPSREVPLCEALAHAARLSLDASGAGIVIEIHAAAGHRAEALDAARELTRALRAPSEYAIPGDRSGCGIAELGRETAIAEVKDPSTEDRGGPLEVRIGAWPGRDEVARGRARVLVGALE